LKNKIYHQKHPSVPCHLRNFFHTPEYERNFLNTLI